MGRSSGIPISWNVGRTAFNGRALTRITGIPLPVNVRIVCVSRFTDGMIAPQQRAVHVEKYSFVHG